jgi:hypothetical protein
MSAPLTLAEVAAHVAAHGGLWRVVPLARGLVQPRPVFVLLRLVQSREGPFVSWDGGASPEDQLARPENAALRGATWIPVDARGERIET